MGIFEMNGYLLDTHIRIWYLYGSDRITEQTKTIMESTSSDCWISPISVREIGVLTMKGKITLESDLRDWVERTLSILPLRIAPLNLEISIRSCEIDLATGDPADHIILATAEVLDLHLITADQALLEQKYVKALF
ncbi:MAG: type II toxin-antitoxin system VapC family toxin [Candidatus Omnitrophica bacterium]|nr:type II toxin-antitoxin system VapC family toxin [Candidatus Omnitrophota bacterium]